jgi:hypothetical protein
MREFRHLHAAHCESGVTAALLRHQGLELSEPLVFGIGSGIFFFYPPLVRVMGMPLVSFRTYPGGVFKLVCKRLGITAERSKFLRAERGVRALDGLLARGVPVGLQANMFWLSYFPREFRSQFNGHNLIALARSGDTYTLSDPVLKEPVTLAAEALRRARFSQGVLAAHGALFHPTRVPERVEIAPAVHAAIRDSAQRMLSRAPIVGVNGIRRLARHVRNWARTIPDVARQKLLLGHVVRMQEEVGTGGAGFRYLYAAFLQEAGERLEHRPYREASERMTEAGDLWRAKFAGTAARIIKDRNVGGESLADAAAALETCAAAEEGLFRELLASVPEGASASLTLRPAVVQR